MKKGSLRKTLCMAMATITLLSFTACGNSGKTELNAENTVAELETENSIIPIEDVKPTALTTGTDSAGDLDNEAADSRKYTGTIVDKYPDADYIECIADGKFVIIYRDLKNYKTNITVYDIVNDKELNTSSIYNCDTYALIPVIYYGKGFGFITPHAGKNPGAFAYYYDTDGNLVNKFDKKLNSGLNGRYVLAQDGSALYMVVDDREVCACGFDLKADFTTQIYKLYPDGTEVKLADYDSHYIIYPVGTLDNGKLVLAFNYNPKDREVLSHADYERLYSLAVQNSSEGDALKIEIGYAFMNTDDQADHELEKIHLTDRLYERVFINNDTITLINSMNGKEILQISPDENGKFKGFRYEIPIEIKGNRTGIYISSTGKYVVIAVGHDDTSINVLRLEDNKLNYIFEKKYDGWSIDINRDFRKVLLDEDTGDFFGRYFENDQNGFNEQLFHVNIFEN